MDPAFFTVRTPHPHTHQQHLHRMYEPPGMPAWTGMHACCCSSCYAHELMQHPWIGILCLCSTLHGRHPKKSFSKILEAVSRPEFAQDHESGLRSDRGPVVLCDFSKLRFWKSPYDFLNLCGRFCPYNPPHKPGNKSIAATFMPIQHFEFSTSQKQQSSASAPAALGTAVLSKVLSTVNLSRITQKYEHPCYWRYRNY